MAEGAVALRDYAVGAVEPVRHLAGYGGIVEEVDGERHDIGSAEAKNVDPLLKTENRREDTFPGMEDDAAVVDVQCHLLDGRIRNLADKTGGEVVEYGVVGRREKREFARRAAVIVGAVTGKAEF